jgi:hypothetical protein
MGVPCPIQCPSKVGGNTDYQLGVFLARNFFPGAYSVIRGSLVGGWKGTIIAAPSIQQYQLFEREFFSHFMDMHGGKGGWVGVTRKGQFNSFSLHGGYVLTGSYMQTSCASRGRGVSVNSVLSTTCISCRDKKGSKGCPERQERCE